MLFVYIFIVTTILLIGFLPLLYGERKRHTLMFAINALAFGLWIFSNYIYQQSPDFLFWTKMAILGPIFMPITLLIFILEYPEPLKRLSNPQMAIGFILPIFLAISLFPTPFIVKDVPVFDQIIWGPGYYLFSIYFSLTLLGVLSLMIRGLFKYKGASKVRLKFIFWGLSLTVIFGAICNLFLPLLFNITALFSIGPLFSLFFIGFSTIAILKHRLLNLFLIINKSIAWALTSVCIIGCLSLITWLYQRYFSPEITGLYVISMGLLLLITGTFFQQLRIKFQSTANKVFLKGHYNYNRLLKQISESLSECNDIPTLTNVLKSLFKDDIEIDTLKVLLPESYLERLRGTFPLIEQQTNANNTPPITLTEDDLVIQTLQSQHQTILTIKDNNHPPLKDELKRLSTELVLPIYTSTHTIIGILLIGKKLNENTYTSTDIDLFTTLASQLSGVLDRLKKGQTAAQIGIAKTIQTQILPNTPQIPGLNLTCHMQPASDVGGDYYDIIRNNQQTWLFLGDVAGHGVGSGLVMFMVQSIISSILYQNPEISPKRLTFLANKILCQNLERLDEQRPMTLMSLNMKTPSIFEVCGSNETIHIFRHESQKIETLQLNHFPLGIGLTDELEEANIEQEQFHLNPKDLLFIGTDGIIEAYKNGDINQAQFNEDRLLSLIKDHIDQPIEELKSTLINTLHEYTNGIYHDDITFMIARAI
ncbi:MAG: hypothetical protein CL521_01220 [Actinobacteria bacterium]|nr:hypothetical protein [Actinomycetota bacterium]